MIKVYDYAVRTDYKVDGNGLGVIHPTKCTETKKIGLNGWYIDVECGIQYASLIAGGRIVVTETKEKGVQPFVITGQPTKENKKISFKATHVLFETKNYILENPFVATGQYTAQQFLTALKNAVLGGSAAPFTLSSDIDDHIIVGNPLEDGYITLYDALARAEELYGGVVDANGWTVNLVSETELGADNGQSVAYGRDITGAKITEDWDKVCTKIFPVIASDGTPLTAKYMTSSVQYDKPYTKVVAFDIADEDDQGNKRTDAQKQQLLQEMAQAYLDTYSTPQISYEIKADVSQTLDIGDLITVKHPMVSIKTNVREYTYDTNQKRVKSIIFGNYSPSLSDALTERISSIVSKSSGSGSGSGGGGGTTLPDEIPAEVVYAKTNFLKLRGASNASNLPEVTVHDTYVGFNARDAANYLSVGPSIGVQISYGRASSLGGAGSGMIELKDGRLFLQQENKASVVVGNGQIELQARDETSNGSVDVLLDPANQKVKITAPGGLWVNGTQVA